jgi:CCR4-NOT transcription complex subunit 9
MSNNKSNDLYENTENEYSENNENEEKLIIKYTNEIINEETRAEAIEHLYKYREKNDKIAIYLWFSRGTMAALLQELINIYQYIITSKLTSGKANQAKYIISLFQIIALNPTTRKEFLESELLAFLYPFLKCPNKSKLYEIIKVTSLGVIAALVKIDDSDVINYLIKSEIIPVILKIMQKGTCDIMGQITSFIIQRIINDINGLKYICEMRERLMAIKYVLEVMLQNKNNNKMIKNILRIYLGLIENKEAKTLLKRSLPEKLRDSNFIRNLDNSSQAKVNILLKSLEEDEAGTDIKIIKLKNDLTNNIQNINIINNNNLNNYNNGNKINMNNNEMNMNNNKNINMMFINNMNNQIKMQTGFMRDFNYNIYNDNDNYMNVNIYNQNKSNGFSNMNFYNTYNNI